MREKKIDAPWTAFVDLLSCAVELNQFLYVLEPAMLIEIPRSRREFLQRSGARASAPWRSRG